MFLSLLQKVQNRFHFKARSLEMPNINTAIKVIKKTEKRFRWWTITPLLVSNQSHSTLRNRISLPVITACFMFNYRKNWLTYFKFQSFFFSCPRNNNFCSQLRIARTIFFTAASETFPFERCSLPIDETKSNKLSATRKVHYFERGNRYSQWIVLISF